MFWSTFTFASAATVSGVRQTLYNQIVALTGNVDAT